MLIETDFKCEQEHSGFPAVSRAFAAASIAFLVGQGFPPAGGPNANMPKATSTFWFEKGTDRELLHLQYIPRVILDFGGLSSPPPAGQPEHGPRPANQRPNHR